MTGFILLIMALASGSGFLMIKNLYYICQPNEVLIFAGEVSGRAIAKSAIAWLKAAAAFAPRC